MSETTITVNSVAELREIIRNQAGEGKMLTIKFDSDPQSDKEVIETPTDGVLHGASRAFVSTDEEVVYGYEEHLGVGSVAYRGDTSYVGVVPKREILEGDRADG